MFNSKVVGIILSLTRDIKIVLLYQIYIPSLQRHTKYLRIYGIISYITFAK